MPDLTRQQLCAALGISESTVRRLELLGLPFTPVGLRAKRYNLDDNYTKKTCLWTGGGFVMPTESRAEGLIEPDDRIHKCPQGP